MKHFKFLAMLLLVSILAFSTCGGDSGSGGGGDDETTSLTFESADTPGDAVTVTIGSETIVMIYANNQTTISFPIAQVRGTPSDYQKAILTKKFFMSETQVTNALMTEVLQWAYNNGKFSTTVSDPNGLDATTAKHGGQQLLDFDSTSPYGEIKYSKINYSDGHFTVDSGFENYPVECVTWYGAVMFCNWLTEMCDGNTDNCVYNEADTTWDHTETVENTDRTGYRLPSGNEWEYAARYIGTNAPTQGNLSIEYIAQSHNGGNAGLTAGYYWAPASYASGAVKDYRNEIETRAVGWYSGDPGMGGSDRVMPVKQKNANQLGVYDMSGNVWEWCFTVRNVSSRERRGGTTGGAVYLQVGYWDCLGPDLACCGFRFARTQ